MKKTNSNQAWPEKKKERSDLEERVVRSEELFCGNKEIVIEHQGTQYRLIITKAGKLVLNK